MSLVDGPTGENDNMICVAYKHQFDLINESTGDAYRLHHVEANRVRCTCTHRPHRQQVKRVDCPLVADCSKSVIAVLINYRLP